ncbi:polyphosphate kinase 2 family protein [soil metagenome]
MVQRTASGQPAQHRGLTVGAFTDRLRVGSGPVDLSGVDPSSTPGVELAQDEGKSDLDQMESELLRLQTQLLASRSSKRPRSLLLVLQGVDAAGKGGAQKKTIGLMDPVGLRVQSFKAPTEEERSHDFLWRIEKAVPEHGFLGVFDRSHYEDVLIQRVRSLAPSDEIERRYGAINEFEKRLVDNGTHVLKVMLHISPEQQKRRLRERLEDPTKYWKFNPGDVDERQLWDDYQRAYEIALERCSTDHAPWHVLPADQKWYRNLALAHLLKEALEAMGLEWPPPDFDLEVEKARLEADTVS